MKLHYMAAGEDSAHRDLGNSVFLRSACLATNVFQFFIVFEPLLEGASKDLYHLSTTTTIPPEEILDFTARKFVKYQLLIVVFTATLEAIPVRWQVFLFPLVVGFECAFSRAWVC